jgi:hypothetical protein
MLIDKKHATFVSSNIKPEPPMTCFRGSKNLKGHLVQSKLSKEKDTVAGCSSVEVRNVMWVITLWLVIF